jgi:microsomal epoxide hydrolase
MPSMGMMIMDNHIADLATAEEKMQMEKAAEWRQTGMAYALEHGTRPATVGLTVSSSPLAMLAW